MGAGWCVSWGKTDRRNAIWIPLFGLLCVVIWSVYSLLHISPFAASWDEVDFVLALDRFDLLAMQPHFPGYPYFVLGAMAVQQVVNDPLIAYGTLNIMLTASAAVPIWLLARRLLSPAWSLLVVLMVLTSPYLWLQTMRPMSEAAGIAVLWWYLWCWWRAMERADMGVCHTCFIPIRGIDGCKAVVCAIWLVARMAARGTVRGLAL